MSMSFSFDFSRKYSVKWNFSNRDLSKPQNDWQYNRVPKWRVQKQYREQHFPFLVSRSGELSLSLNNIGGSWFLQMVLFLGAVRLAPSLSSLISFTHSRLRFSLSKCSFSVSRYGFPQSTRDFQARLQSRERSLSRIFIIEFLSISINALIGWVLIATHARKKWRSLIN